MDKLKMCESAGCMAKLGGNELSKVLTGAFNEYIPEDCACFCIDGNEMLYTIDFGPLIGDDPFIGGKIAALHAISDIYASNGIPLFALGILQITNDNTISQATEILKGMRSACDDEHVSVVGGHTIKSKELIAGLSVIGKKNSIRTSNHKKNCKVDDVLMMSKPIGTGIAVRAYYHKIINHIDFQEAIDIMLTSNACAIKAFDQVDVHACTDITGFGLLGHLSEMLPMECGAIIWREKIRILDCVLHLTPTAALTEYIKNNIEYVYKRKKCTESFRTISDLALVDPQTNGPIILSVSKQDEEELKKIGFYTIGVVNDSGTINIC